MCASFPTLKSVYNHIFALNAIGHASSTHQHNQLVQFIFYSFEVQEKNRSACIYNVGCATAMASIICFSIIFIFSNNHVHRHRLKVKKKMRPARTHTHTRSMHSSIHRQRPQRIDIEHNTDKKRTFSEDQSKRTLCSRMSDSAAGTAGTQVEHRTNT